MSRDRHDMVAVVTAVDVSNGKLGFEYCRLECHNRQYGTPRFYGTAHHEFSWSSRYGERPLLTGGRFVRSYWFRIELDMPPELTQIGL
jgi:hypothetical protein